MHDVDIYSPAIVLERRKTPVDPSSLVREWDGTATVPRACCCTKVQGIPELAFMKPDQLITQLRQIAGPSGF